MEDLYMASLMTISGGINSSECEAATNNYVKALFQQEREKKTGAQGFASREAYRSVAIADAQVKLHCGDVLAYAMFKDAHHIVTKVR